MTTLQTVENKVSQVKKYLKILERYQDLTKEEILNDLDKKGAVERYLYLAVQATIDSSDAFIGYKKLRKPTSMSEIFYVMNEEGLINQELVEKMIKMTGFRNVIAHDYEKVDYDIVMSVLHEGLGDIRELLKILEK